MLSISVFSVVGISFLGFNLTCKLFLEPILAVNIAFNDEGYNIVACGVDHGCRGIYEVAEGKCDGECNCELIGEEQRAENKLAGTAAARDTAHCDGREYRDYNCEDDLTGVGVDSEEAEQEQNLYDSAH